MNVQPSPRRRGARMLLSAALLLTATARAGDAPKAPPPYVPADSGERPKGKGPQLLPDRFLRGYDPVTVWFDSDAGPARGAADDGAALLKIAPAWPGAWFWSDRRTLQFRPAEPWSPLARFAVEAAGQKRILTTMMSAPSGMSPPGGSENLRPFRTVTLTFPQALALDSLRQMLRLEIREAPGLADSPRVAVKDFSLALLPRSDARDAATYAITLESDVPEGRVLQVEVGLALGDEGRTLWTGRLATRPPFQLQSVRCGATEVSVTAGAQAPRDTALACGSTGEAPQLVFSATVQDLTLTTLRALVRLEPAVPDLSFESWGSRVSLRGRFLPDTLYRLRIGAAPVHDDSGRTLRDPGRVELYFHRGWKSAFLRWSRATAVLESRGPRMLPLAGYGDARADVRIHRVDALHAGLWPFPQSPLVVDEQRPPPFPGEEPERAPGTLDGADTDEMVAHIRLLGTPLVSKVVDLPLASRGGTTSFGLDLAPLLDPVTGANRPGTYLVGLRRLVGPPQRAWMRVQVTNLSVTAVEERDRVVFFVRTLDRAEPVRGAKIVLEGTRRGPAPQRLELADTATVSTDGEGRAVLGRLVDWVGISRVSVRDGDDVLVVDPRDPPPKFASNHWSWSSSWLHWLMDAPPPPVNEKTLAFVFTERPIYRPGEKVFYKGWIRRKVGGDLKEPLEEKAYGLRLEQPDGQTRPLALSLSGLCGFDGEFQDKDAPTGQFTLTLFGKDPYSVLSQRSFRVEAYRIPTFEVQLAGGPAVRLDAPFKVRAAARYYAGGNVAGRPVAWTVTRRPWHHVPAGREGFLFASSEQFARQGAARPPETITRGAVLDDGGADEITVNPALDIDGSARVYRFEAVVTGPDDQPVAAATEVRALPPFVLGMKLQRYLEKAVEVRPEIIAVGVDDKLLAGQDVHVRLYRRVWHSNLRETAFARGEAKYVTEQEDVKLLEQTVKTADKVVVPALPIRGAGVYVVELVARDKLGRVQTLSADLYAGGPAPVAWRKSREGVFETTPDKKAYRPGETAKLVIQSPFQTGRALVVVEEPGANTYAWEEIAGGKAVHEVRIAAHHVPNLPVHVIAMRGRTGEGQTEDGRYRPQTVAASVDLEVEPVRNTVAVGIEHPESVRPGAKADFVLTLQDSEKKPLAGEVAMWLVDEAVLSLAREASLDPLERFVDRNARTSTLRDTRNTVVGRLFEQEEEPGGGGMEEEESGAGKRVVRRNFQTVPYWAATLQVPSSGRLVVPVKMSDDLTNFKVRAVAASGFSRFGWKQTVLRVRLPVLVQPQLPRFARQGDRFFAGAIARLVEGPEGPATVDLAFTGPVDAPRAQKSAELKLNRAESVRVPIELKSVAGPETLTVKVGVTRRSDGAGDAFEVQIPVLPDRRPERLAWFEKAKEGHLALRDLPEAARPGTLTQKLVFTTEPGVLEMASAMDYLAQYPHGCLEQRLSQVNPAVATGSLLRKLGFDDAYVNRTLSGAKQLLSELGTFQDDQGLFAFWPGGRGDIQLTAQAVEFLDAATKSGLPVDEKTRARAVTALEKALRSDHPALLPGYRWNQQTAALRALARMGRLDEHYLVDLFHQRADMDATSLADLATAMSGQPQAWRSNLDQLRADLWDGVIFRLSRGQPVFDGLKWRRPGWTGAYLGSNTAAVAAVFESLVRVDPANEKLLLLRDALVSFATADNGFGSTHDNRRAIEALAVYVDKTATPAPSVKISLAAPAREIALDAGHRVAMASFEADAPAALDVKGGEAGMRAQYTWMPAAPGTALVSLRQGFVVSRASTLVKADGTQDAWKDDVSGSTLTLATGDILEIHARIVSEEERYHVALVVPLAAGLEPLNPALENAPAEARPSESDTISPTYVQRLDDEVRYYFTRLPRGTQTLHFRVRASTPGAFVHPAPWAEQMYRQEVRGRGDGMKVVVAEK